MCPEGIRDSFFKGVIARLRDTARDAVTGVNITDLNDLKNALREYFAPKKDYTHYCGELQGVRMRRAETVMEYYSRIKRLMESAKASLRERFEETQIPHMTTMLEGIALESFKRGLSDDLLYAVSVQEPDTLSNALKIAQRIERDMTSNQDRSGNIRILEAERPSRRENTDHPSTSWTPYQSQRDRSRSPWKPRTPETQRRLYDPNQPSQHFRRNSNSWQEQREHPTTNKGYDFTENTPQNQRPPNQDWRSRQRYRPQSYYNYPPVPYPYMPTLPMTYGPQYYWAPPPQQNPRTDEQNLNSMPARRVDAPTSEQASERPPISVKVISASALLNEEETVQAPQ